MALPDNTGLGLKPIHYRQILDDLPSIGWFEVHPENYMGAGGTPHRYLTAIANHYPLSMHGVGMSLGSASGVATGHLAALAELVRRYQPAQVSEHLSWSQFNGQYLNDLLPLPYTEESLQIISDNIDRVQNTLGRTILIENPSSYLRFRHNSYSESEFLAELVQRCDCRLLLDVNNVFVSAVNQGFDPRQYLHAFPLDAVAEIHLAGHAVQSIGDSEVRIDDHGSSVADPVWELHRQTLGMLARPVPVLIEWDTRVPEFRVLVAEAEKANAIAEEVFGQTTQQIPNCCPGAVQP